MSWKHIGNIFCFGLFFNLAVLQIVLCPAALVLMPHEGEDLCPSLLNPTSLLTKDTSLYPETK